MHEIQAELQIGRARYDVSDITEDDAGNGHSMIVHELGVFEANGGTAQLVPPNVDIRLTGFAETVAPPPGVVKVLTKVRFERLDD